MLTGVKSFHIDYNSSGSMIVTHPITTNFDLTPWTTVLTPDTDLRGLELMMKVSSSGADRGFIEIATQENGVDIPRLTNAHIRFNIGIAVYINIPIHFKAGIPIRLRVRAVDNVTITGAAVGLPVIPGHHKGYSYGEQIPLATCDVANGRASTMSNGSEFPIDGTWGEVIAATTKDYHAIMSDYCPGGTAATSGRSYFVEIGAGASSAEKSFFGSFATTTSGNALVSAYRALPIYVPSGTRLAGKFTISGTSSDTVRISVVGYF